jgi:hypothetical protein
MARFSLIIWPIIKHVSVSQVTMNRCSCDAYLVVQFERSVPYLLPILPLDQLHVLSTSCSDKLIP